MIPRSGSALPCLQRCPSPRHLAWSLGICAHRPPALLPASSFAGMAYVGLAPHCFSCPAFPAGGWTRCEFLSTYHPPRCCLLAITLAQTMTALMLSVVDGASSAMHNPRSPIATLIAHNIERVPSSGTSEKYSRYSYETTAITCGVVSHVYFMCTHTRSEGAYACTFCGRLP